MTTRRKFIKKISTVGAALPLASQVSAKSMKKDNPIIICSRGEQSVSYTHLTLPTTP